MIKNDMTLHFPPLPTAAAPRRSELLRPLFLKGVGYTWEEKLISKLLREANDCVSGQIYADRLIVYS